MSDVTLEISLYGPFVYELGRTVTVYAPRCDGHLASLQTDEVERALDGCDPDRQFPCAYELQDENKKVDFYSGSGSCCNPDKLIRVETWRKLETPELSNCYFRLEVPRPDHITGLIADSMSYIEYDLIPPKPWKYEQRATAMRLHYCGIDQAKKLQIVQVNGNGKWDAVPVSLAQTTPQTHVPITFRYSGSGIFDNNHRDAEHCFMQMRALFPPLGSWTASFDDPQGLGRIDRLGGDCKAAQILFLSYEEKERWSSGSGNKPKKNSGAVSSDPTTNKK